jgi:alpha-tubulin suppressor-like RCC1 family protein
MEVIHVACTANYSSFAVTKNGEVYAWGHNREGCLGVGNLENQNIPTKVNIPEEVSAIAAGDRHLIALTKKRNLYAWGWNLQYQVGFADCTNYPSPLPIASPAPVLSIACGYYHSVIFCEQSKIFMWGANNHGEYGIEHSSTWSPVCIPQQNWKPRVWGRKEKWEMLKWIFMGRQSEDSEFWGIPVEIVYHFVHVLYA